MSRSVLLLCVLAACARDPDPSDNDIVGPFSGLQRFVVDRIDVPTNSPLARELADDLDGDGVVDNQAGTVIASLFGIGDGNTHGADLVTSGAIASVVFVQADDLVTDETVGVSYVGADGDASTVVGGSLFDGALVSNRTRDTRVPGDAILVLPVFQDTDASRIHLVGMELEMLADGRGGFEITMHGGIRAQDAADAVGEGLLHMIEARPQSHLSLIRDVDVDHDGQLSAPEIATASLIRALLSPDIHMFDGDDFAPRPASDDLDVLSFGLRVHVIPCADGNCALVPPASTCFDRLLDGSETDIDCGGPVCGACPDAARCALPTDCQTGACDGGACRAATCSDGILDGFESDVDCGAACNNCGVDQACYNDSDCGSNHCSSQFGKGKCQ